MSKQILNIPAGYEASFTTDALTTGSYLQYDEAHTGYSAVSLAASTSYTIGPFNTVTNFQFNTVGNTQINFDIEFSGYYTAADEASAGGTPAESDVTFTDIDTNNASTDMHGYLPKLSGDDTEYLNGDGGWSQPPSGGTVNDTDIVFTDNTTNDVSTDEHGYAPKLSGDATEYLDGTGAYSVPAGGGGGAGVISLVNQTNVISSLLTSGSIVKVPFNNAISDSSSCFDTTNNKFTAPSTGIYTINATVGSQSTGAVTEGRAIVLLFINGAEQGNDEHTFNASGSPVSQKFSISRTISLTASDYVEIYFYQTTGSTLNLDGVNTSGPTYTTCFAAIQIA